MTVDPERLKEVVDFYPDAQGYHEMGVDYLYIPDLKITTRSGTEARDALVCLGPRDGYATRLFLSAPVSGAGQNWSIHQILGRSWHVCSIRDVSAGQRPLQILAEHLRLMR